VAVQRFDFIIVGAGSAGCVLANRLSARGNYQVALLESGGKDRHPLIHLPVGFTRAMSLPSLNWGYQTEPEAGLRQRHLSCPRGKVLGGSGAINGMIYVRGQREDFDRWQALGCHDWGFESVLPYFRKSERQCRGANYYHGASGEMAVSDGSLQHVLSRRYIDAGLQAGLALNQDFNGEIQDGIGYSQFTIDEKGRRASSTRAFLETARRHRNLHIFTGTHVDNVIIENGEATGVQLASERGARVLLADREVVLSAGAINSPQLLLLSGIGDAKQLQQRGIQVKHHLPQVGQNLHDHLTIDVVTRVRNTDTANDYLKPHRFLGQVLKYAAKRQGFLAMAAAQVLAFVKSRAGIASPDLQIHFAPAAGAKNAKGQVVPMKAPAITSTACHLRPDSRGTLDLSGPDPRQAPLIRFNYLAAEADQQAMIAAVKWQRRLFQQEALATVIDTELTPGAESQSDDEILDYVRREAVSVYHPAGSCRMGSDKDAVVDQRLAVNGIGRLRVADTSVMPSLVSGNTHAATVMIAERAAEWMLESARHC